MKLDSLRLTAIIPATPQRVYAAWLDAKEHSAFTGSKATIEPRVGGRYTAWDGYISGRHVELSPGKTIVQTWRTTEFPPEAGYSRLELRLRPTGPGGNKTTLTLIHTDIWRIPSIHRMPKTSRKTACSRTILSNAPIRRSSQSSRMVGRHWYQ